MAAEYKEIREAIGEIARQDPVIRTALQRLRARGVLDGIEARVFSGEQDPDDCCENDPDPDEMEDEEDPDDEDTPDGKNPGGEDPTSGEKKKKNMDGNYELPNGDRVPWDETGCVPDNTWVMGFYWRIVIAGNTYNGTSPNDVALQLQAHYLSSGTPTYRVISADYTLTQYGSQYRIEYTLVQESFNSSTGEWDEYTTTAATYARLNTCPPEYISTGTFGCDATEPPCIEPGPWPSDGECQEALIGGKFVPHPDDPDCASKAPRDYQILCDDEGYCVAYVPMKDGGHMRFQVDENGAYAGGNTTYYDEKGNQYDTGAYSPEDVKFRAANPDSLPPAWTGG